MRRIMNSQEVLEIYKNIIENSNLLANGQEYLEKIIGQVSNFCTQSIFLISDLSIDIKTRNYISSIIKNILYHNWDSNNLIAQEKNAIRQECLAGVQKSIDDATIQQNLGDLICSFIIKDGIQDWKEPLKLLIQLTLSEKTLDFYCLIFSKVDNRINQIVPILFEHLLAILLRSECIITRQKCLILYYLAIQTFSFAEDVDDDLMRECLDKTYCEYINFFIQILHADERKFYPNQLMVLKIFNSLFKEFPNYTENTFQQKIIYLLKYLKKIIEINYEFNLRQTPSVSFFVTDQEKNQIEELFEKYLSHEIDIEYDNDIQLFVNECINFVDVIMNYTYAENIYTILAFPFINIISNLIFVGKQQENLIADDPNLFAASERDNEDEVNNIRIKTIKCIEKLLDNDALKQIVITSIIQISESMFCNRSEQPLQIIYQELQTQNNLIQLQQLVDNCDANLYNEFIIFSSLHKQKELPEWKGKEISLFLLGSFQKQITSFYHQNTGYTFQFIKNLIQEFSTKYLENVQNQFLMCRYYQCFSQFANIICQCTEYVDIVMKSLIYTFSNESSQALKIIALACLASSCQHLKQEINNFQIFDSNNCMQIVKSILQVIQESSEDILPHILNSLVPIFSNLSQVSNMFTENGMQIIMKLINHFEGKADIQKKVIDFIHVLAKYPVSYSILFREFEQQILNCFQTLDNFIKSHNDMTKIKQQDINVIQNRIQILKVLIQFKTTNEIIFKDCQNVLLKLLYINDDFTLQQEATLCLKQIIISQPQSLIENKQDLQMLLLKLVQNLTIYQEAFSQFLPNLIIVSYDKLLEINREITESILVQLSQCKSYFIIITFLVFFTRLIEKNPKETLQFLINFRTADNQSGLEIFFCKLNENYWYINKDLIKNSIYLPLAKLLIIEENLLQQFKFGNQELESGFQFFCFLSRALEIEMSPDQYENHQESENLQSHQELQQCLIDDICQIGENKLLTTTKDLLIEFFQTMYTNENTKGAFQKFVSQMDFDEKIAIENVINQVQNKINPI
ncbi:hypothetical protein TTHERM_00316170 (macronuclear) [Tetrahymena thermophila SB210]|uniref:Importin-beta amine-terminal domain protein n=1 Tax=Tetrahymena thermophila (strain SB210) TaxID=312017 RepID=I7LW68_TETTS|nr:hypothetical protein TTHERM_00316170 [Tetrahymena thermophila SB210]EAS01064.2 hypothetical protein TTHERM_00316170 [Tetrahymena thermophila SB210]|eukprot:XP_001021309.2 hypothetical protein TTHERM_00316170 [Tetrahymena thermophila SB210]